MSQNMKDKISSGERVVLSGKDHPNWQRILPQSQKDQQTATIKAKYASGEIVAWNKGLTGFTNRGSFKKGHKINVGRIISEEIKIKTSGKNHYLWINDRTKLKDDHKDRGGQLHREWSKSVKNRDNWKCKIEKIKKKKKKNKIELEYPQVPKGFVILQTIIFGDFYHVIGYLDLKKVRILCDYQFRKDEYIASYIQLLARITKPKKIV